MTEMHNEVYKAMPENIHAHKHTHRGEKKPKTKKSTTEIQSTG